jgi:hypothetical protein
LTPAAASIFGFVAATKRRQLNAINGFTFRSALPVCWKLDGRSWANALILATTKLCREGQIDGATVEFLQWSHSLTPGWC